MTERRTHGVITEPVEYQARPSDQFLQQLRDMGASEDTIRRARGDAKPRMFRLRGLKR